MESDLIGLAGGLNTYGYVGANPIGATDPLGLDYNVCLIPGWPAHIGIAPNSDNTSGRRTDGTSDLGDILRGNVPGRVNPDPTTYRYCVSVPATKEQDEFLAELIRTSGRDPGPYNWRTRSCVDFVRDAFKRGLGVPLGETNFPGDLFHDIVRRYQAPVRVVEGVQP